jgi:hypothetical protein
MQLTLYVLGNKVIVPTVSRTQAGYNLETEPVASLDLADPALPEVLQHVLERGNPIIPTPSRANFPKPVVLSYAGAKSWSEFTEIADRWELTEHNGTYTLARGTRDSDANYWGGKEKLPIPLNATGTRPNTSAIVDAILSATMDRGAKSD